MNYEPFLLSAVIVLYLCGMLQTMNAITFFSSAPYFDRKDGILLIIFGPLLGLLFWPVVAVTLFFMSRAEKKRLKS